MLGSGTRPARARDRSCADAGRAERPRTGCRPRPTGNAPARSLQARRPGQPRTLSVRTSVPCGHLSGTLRSPLRHVPTWLFRLASACLRSPRLHPRASRFFGVRPPYGRCYLIACAVSSWPKRARRKPLTGTETQQLLWYRLAPPEKYTDGRANHEKAIRGNTMNSRSGRPRAPNTLKRRALYVEEVAVRCERFSVHELDRA